MGRSRPLRARARVLHYEAPGDKVLMAAAGLPLVVANSSLAPVYFAALKADFRAREPASAPPPSGVF